jgi:hypothetical protein
MSSANASNARISFGIQLAVALLESGKCPPIPPLGSGTDADQAAWDHLYDLAVVHQLETWEKQGFRAHIEAGLPSAAEAAAEISGSQCADLTQTLEPAEPLILDEPPPRPIGPIPATLVDIRVNPDSLIARLQQFFSDHFAWTSRELLEADVFVEFLDEDAGLNAMAEFLWKNRNLLQRHQTDEDKQR